MRIEYTVVKCAAYLNKYLGEPMHRGKSGDFTASIGDNGVLSIDCKRSVYSLAEALDDLTDMDDMNWYRVSKEVKSLPSMDKACRVNFYTEDIGDLFICTLVHYDTSTNLGTVVIDKKDWNTCWKR